MIKPTALLLLLATAVLAKKYSRIEAADEGGDKQVKLLELFSGLGQEDNFDHVHQQFPYTDPQLYTNQEALQNFTTYWEQGFLDKKGVFTMNCRRTNRDTASLFRLFYFAKDFETMYTVAKWAKGEVQHDMYVYALLSAITTREDTFRLLTPPLFEALPNYFLPSSVINQAYRAKLNGVESRKFRVNNTGWEWSWHNSWGMSSPLVVQQTNKKDYDVEARLSYYREDVSRMDFMIKSNTILGIALPSVIKDVVHVERLGELQYFTLKWLLNRYNLERYAVHLPPVEPISMDEPIVAGYDSQIIGLYGRPVPGRPDNLVPRMVNPEAVAEFEEIATRYLDIIESGRIWNMTTPLKYDTLKGLEEFNKFALKVFSGDSQYYPSVYFNLLALIDGLVTSSNRVEYATGTLLNGFTMMRDPAYYQILAYIEGLFNNFQSQLKPYTKQELGFPGVEISNVEVSRLETFFEYFDYDISSSVPSSGNGKYLVSQFRLNQKPFAFNIKINSDKETNAVIKIFMGPATDTRNQKLEFNKLRESLTVLNIGIVKLHQGENTIKQSPFHNQFSSKMLRIKDINQKIQEAQTDKVQCYYPSNLILPKGSENGTPIQFYVVVYPYQGTEGPMQASEETCTKNNYILDNDHIMHFPIDRFWVKSSIDQPNHKIITSYIYHTDVQTQNSS